jgi:hypothetical protein
MTHLITLQYARPLAVSDTGGTHQSIMNENHDTDP